MTTTITYDELSWTIRIEPYAGGGYRAWVDGAPVHGKSSLSSFESELGAFAFSLTELGELIMDEECPIDEDDELDY